MIYNDFKLARQITEEQLSNVTDGRICQIRWRRIKTSNNYNPNLIREISKIHLAFPTTRIATNRDPVSPQIPYSDALSHTPLTSRRNAEFIQRTWISASSLSLSLFSLHPCTLVIVPFSPSDVIPHRLRSVVLTRLSPGRQSQFHTTVHNMITVRTWLSRFATLLTFAVMEHDRKQQPRAKVARTRLNRRHCRLKYATRARVGDRQGRRERAPAAPLRSFPTLVTRCVPV